MWRCVFLASVFFGLPACACAYVDVSPTLGTVIRDSSNIVVLRVDKVSKDKRVIIFKKVADLKGQHLAEEVRHQISDGLHPREPQAILDWAVPGKVAICFHNGKVAQTCIGTYWYESAASQAPWWSMTRGLAERSLAYFGTAEKLHQHLVSILAGKEVVITAIRYTEEDRGKKFVVMNRNVYRGKDFPVWRIKASLKMPGQAYEVARTTGAVIGPGAGGPEDVPGLLKHLNHKDPRWRRDAAIDLGLIGPPARSAVLALTDALKDDDRLVRVHAAEALGRIDVGGPHAIPALAKLLREQDAHVRQVAAYALGNLGPDATNAVADLVTALQDGDASVRSTAAETLGRVGPGAVAAVPALVLALKDGPMRGMAADALGGIGSAAKAAIPELSKVVQDPDTNVGWAAAMALVRIEPASATAAVPLFIKGLASGQERLRLDSITQLSAMGPAAKDAIPVLTELTRAGDILVAATLVAVAGPEATVAIPVLIGQLPSDAWDVSGLLAAIGPAAVPALVEALKTSSGPGAQRASYALGQIGRKSKDVVPALIAMLKHKDAHGRLGSARALGTIDPKATEAVPALTDALKDENVWVRLSACSSLVKINGREAKDVVPVLRAALREGDFWPRRSATATLADLGPAAQPVVPALTALLKDPDAGVRSTAARALLNLQAVDVKMAVETMVAALKDKDVWTRQQSALFLGDIGPAAQAALPALAEALADENEDVRKAAADALKKLRSR